MKRYIEQLIEDLEQVAKNPPNPAYFEVPPNLDDKPEAAELAQVPYKPISEWTGIAQEVFPLITDLEGDQWGRVNDAIFKVFDSLGLTLVDAPEDMPQEWLYEVLTTNWDHPVQFLPLSGMDLELCTGDPMTCPYGDYCDCGEEFDEFELPDKFAPCINPIAQLIDAGFVCYLNPDTLDIEEVPKGLADDPDGYKMLTGFGLENEELKHESWEKCYVFEPLEAFESFEIMEAFAENMEDEIQQEELLYVLHNKKPFANFKDVVHKLGQSDNWFYFKMKCLEDRVRYTIYKELYENAEPPGDSELPS
ncbi:UPF0158 family protein [Mangrovibacterium marinum]|uniref:Uncharacterized protein UPF0158 n=1 Tax=Mangrovibacterium marinum TaxID=1639118 RepID=A0A2T5C496_9BACT|nr:UPF0158 family protein [Mangrovibacterium marinum]PTN09621.1 uncharacterized protein UPF0158 [Mangrovibacterium marinum]